MKDIDKLQKRNRTYRDLTERLGSTGLAVSGLIGLLFLGVLVWQIAEPTFISGEEGEITAASESIPVTDYILKWDFANIDSKTGELTTEPIVLRLTWEDEGREQSHDLQVNIIEEKGVTKDVSITSDGLDSEILEIGRKTKFYLYSNLDVIVEVEQISGPVPSADSNGYPVVDSFVVSGNIHVLSDDDGDLVFQPLELIGYAILFLIILVMTWPKLGALNTLSNLQPYRRFIRPIFYAISGVTLVMSQEMFVAAVLGAVCWALSGIMLNRILEGMERLQNIGRELSETSRLKHSISNRDGLLMWSRMLFVTSTIFIPLLIDIPFLTERYQDIFVPYASGIRAAFFGTIWVMLIAMIVSIPISVGAAIYLEEYAKPNQMTKLIQALVTNLAGVPSIVFGMFGLAIFVKQGGIGWGLGPSVLAAG